jgi:xanthine dehydrogenase accessory factor
MRPIEHIASNYLSEGQPFVLATIIGRQGSVPRTAGAKMLIAKDGSIHGTIGGGQMESLAIQAALDLFTNGPAQLLTFDLTGEDASSNDMICGGNTDVLLDLIAPTNEITVVFNAWCKALNRGRKCYFATLVYGNNQKVTDVEHCLLYPEGSLVGNLPPSVSSVEQLLAKVRPTVGITELTEFTVIRQDHMTLILEPSARLRTVYIFGAGHVAKPLASLASMLSFRVTVLDDRAAFANPERFPDADEIRVIEDYGGAFAGVTIEANDFIVILTRGHIHDKTVLGQALRTKAGYIGMIGSRRKRDTIYSKLIDEGFSREDLDRVHSPIGMNIGAETPEEIAVSIIAELIQTRSRSL